MNKESKEREKKLTELGSKVRAGQLMSSLFRAVASEHTELVQTKVPGDRTGKMETKLVSKAEAIVRDIVQKALPGNDIIDAKVQLECRKLVLDRVDGRAGTIGEDVSKQGENIPDKISRINKGFLNEIAAKTKTKTKKAKKEKSGPPKVSMQ